MKNYTWACAAEQLNFRPTEEWIRFLHQIALFDAVLLPNAWALKMGFIDVKEQDETWNYLRVRVTENGLNYITKMIELIQPALTKR